MTEPAPMDYGTTPFGTLLDRLAAGTPVPGGGSGAAVAAAVAAALAAMVGRLTLEGTAAPPGTDTLVADADAIRSRLLDLAGRDADAFQAVLAAGQLPAGAERERARQLAWRECIRIPAEVVRACRDVSQLARRMALGGRPTARADALMAALLATAAAAGTVVNLRLNLNAAGRPEDLRMKVEEAELMLREAQRAAAEARLALEERLGRGAPSAGGPTPTA